MGQNINCLISLTFISWTQSSNLLRFLSLQKNLVEDFQQ